MDLRLARELLCRWIETPTVNPMGREHVAATPVERPLLEDLENVFSAFDVQIERQQCSSLHENLVIRTGGRDSGPAVLFESHMDTVPADDWPDRAFVSRVEGDRVFGRGACDDKGPLASMVMALLSILEEPSPPPQPIILVAAGDEEYGQTGIRHFLERASDEFRCAVFGEPTEGRPLVQHKGTIRWDIVTKGRSAHTSRPELGRNAILDMMLVIQRLAEIEADLQARYTSDLLSPPTLTVSQINGGRTRNAVPDQCTIAVDFRILPGMDCDDASGEVKRRLEDLPLEIQHSPFQCKAPPLSTDLEAPFVQQVTRFCQAQWGADKTPVGQPFGSDASWMPASCPTLVLGPGDIAQAHAVDEYVCLSDVVQCAEVFRQIMLHDWRPS